MLSHDNSLGPHGLYPTWLLCPLNFPGKSKCKIKQVQSLSLLAIGIRYMFDKSFNIFLRKIGLNLRILCSFCIFNCLCKIAQFTCFYLFQFDSSFAFSLFSFYSQNKLHFFCYVLTFTGKYLIYMNVSGSQMPILCQLLSRVQLLVIPWTVSPPGSSVHGFLQARILKWVACPFSRGSS